MKIDGIIFDLDGTLWDSCRVVSESWGITLRRDYGAEHWPSPEEVSSIMGKTAEQIAQLLFSQYGERAMDIAVQCMLEENAYIAHNSGDLYPGVGEMFAALSEKYPLYIVSNCLDGYIQCFLSVTGFGRYIKDFECQGATGLGKADNIRLISERNNMEAPLYLGDTEGDESSARAAGCSFVHAAYGFGGAVAPDAVAQSPAEFVKIIERFEEENIHA